MNPTDPSESLFSYGTLQLPAVQMATFGRLLAGRSDHLVGFTLAQIEIHDPEVVKTSGLTHHPMLVKTGRAEDQVAGTVFSVTADELTRADAYEVDDYRRVLAQLASGGSAWVYADARATP
ncbi:MAG: gamma-glutamylcyclotransferase [Burkholderiales bacterium]|nr:MAG: gamma-glutamylcyclotransferase [Burkholderiales bacterium]